jgi:hypothetical protein
MTITIGISIPSQSPVTSHPQLLTPYLLPTYSLLTPFPINHQLTPFGITPRSPFFRNLLSALVRHPVSVPVRPPAQIRMGNLACTYAKDAKDKNIRHSLTLLTRSPPDLNHPMAFPSAVCINKKY